jgi:hypothetical protein
MANVIIFDPNSTPKKVLNFLASVNTPDYSDRLDVLINPDISGLVNVPLKYLKVENFNVLEMTVLEKADVDLLEQLSAKNTTDAEVLALDDDISNSQISDFVMAKVDTAINNIANLADAKTFLKRMCRYLVKVRLK